MAARFEEAVRLAEQAFTEEFARLVAHLTERLSGVGEDGKPKVFRDSAVDNLAEFFDRFRALNVRSQRAARRAGRAGAAGGAGRRRRRTCATARACASGSRRSWPRSSRRWTGCWSSGPGGGSSGRRRAGGGVMDLVVDPGGHGPGRLRRGDRPGRARPPDDRPRQPRRARRRRPLARRPAARRRAGARPVRPPQRGPGGRARLAGGALAHAPA